MSNFLIKFFDSHPTLSDKLDEINPELATLVMKHGENVISDDSLVQTLIRFRELQSYEKIHCINAIVQKLNIIAMLIQNELEMILLERLKMVDLIET